MIVDPATAEDAGPAAAGPDRPRRSRRAEFSSHLRQLVRAIREGDDAMVERAIDTISRSRRAFAPLALMVGAFAMLFEGLRLIFTHWRLMFVQVLPAMWIWLAMIDLKAHVLHGKDFHAFRGPVLVPIFIGVVLLSVGSFYLNAAFAFAIAQPGTPQIRRGFTQARAHLSVVLASGTVVGLALAFAAVITPRWGLGWFALALGIVVGAMMLTYVTVPARLVGMKSTYSRRDKLTASAVGGAMGALVCTPPYVIGRIGILMLGSHTLWVLGILLIIVGVALQCGATSAVKAIKMSAKLVAGHDRDDAAKADLPADGPTPPVPA